MTGASVGARVPMRVEGAGVGVGVCAAGGGGVPQDDDSDELVSVTMLVTK